MLSAFDAAARLGSFTAASAELQLTQGAISRQVGALENQLEVVLFDRIGKTVRLTEGGKVYAQEIHRALRAIRNASLTAMTSPLTGGLNLAILPTFGTRWLMPRFPAFLKQHPDITVNFVTRLAPFDFRDEDLHAAVHYGTPNWPDTESTFLMDEESFPVCSPGFQAEHSPDDPDKMASVPLLHLSSRADAWDHWFSAVGIAPPGAQRMLFEQLSIITQAAVAGLGAALLPKFLILNELDRGELQVIDSRPLRDERGYYLVTPIEKSGYPPVIALRSWLLEQVKNHDD
ncbi:MAG: LysR family glycine cleavage system transcriptional activator [Halieaceae bacterium]|jgi:LysR family glycine cleavage system transcriptional activator